MNSNAHVQAHTIGTNLNGHVYLVEKPHIKMQEYRINQTLMNVPVHQMQNGIT